MNEEAFVGLCDASMCQWNKNNDCTAPAITVTKRKGHADCDTYLNETNPFPAEEL